MQVLTLKLSLQDVIFTTTDWLNFLVYHTSLGSSTNKGTTLGNFFKSRTSFDDNNNNNNNKFIPLQCCLLTAQYNSPEEQLQQQ